MNAPPTQYSAGLSLKRLLYPLLGRPRAKQILKWLVYSSLIVNTVFYLGDDLEAFASALPEDAGLLDILFEFSTTIDMLAWLGLVFLFELETYVVSEERWSRWLSVSVYGLRLICYVLIAFAAIGYTSEALEYFDRHEQHDLGNLCEIADRGLSVQTRADAYEEITAASCQALSSGRPYYTLSDETAIVTAKDLPELTLLGIMDIENAYIWIIVVLLIELEVWLQNRSRFGTRLMSATRQAKTALYAVLVANGLVWLYLNYYLYAWDAFLWIFGFWAIELNLAEWELEERRDATR